MATKAKTPNSRQELLKYIKTKVTSRYWYISRWCAKHNYDRYNYTGYLNGTKAISLDKLKEIGATMGMKVYMIDESNQRTFEL